MASVVVAVNLSDSNTSGDGNSFLPWDNPDNVIAFETFITAENIINCYINPVIFCIGVPANVLNCVVFSRQGILNYLNYFRYHCQFFGCWLLFFGLFFTESQSLFCA